MYLIRSFISALGSLFSACRRRESSEESTPLIDARGRDALGGPNANNSRASLSSEFRSFDQSSYALKLCLFLVVCYMAIGVVAFSYVFEQWSVTTSAYFSVVTFTTVGYGDFAPATQTGRLFTVFFTLFGVAILGCFLGIIGSYLVEAETSYIEAVKQDSEARVLFMFSKEEGEEQEEQSSGGREPKERTAWAQIREVIVLETPVFIIIILIAVTIGKNQEWTFIDSLYYGTISLSTVGFGDLHPQTQNMRLFCIFFLPVMVAVFGELLGRIASIFIGRTARKYEQEFMSREFTLSDLNAMDRNLDNVVTRGEFLSFMLVAMQKVEQQSLDELNALFDSLDADGSGALDKKDLVLLAQRNKATDA